MKNFKEVAEALLAGETLINRGAEVTYKLNADGNLTRVHIPSNEKTTEDNIGSAPDMLEIYKPTIRIGSYDVPEPVRTRLDDGQVYYCVDLYSDNFYTDAYWINSTYHESKLFNGFIHLTREAAMLHGEALASLTKEKTK